MYCHFGTQFEARCLFLARRFQGLPARNIPNTMANCARIRMNPMCAAGHTTSCVYVTFFIPLNQRTSYLCLFLFWRNQISIVRVVEPETARVDSSRHPNFASGRS